MNKDLNTDKDMKKKLFILVGIILFVLILIVILFHYNNKRTYTINLSQTESVKNIVLKQAKNEKKYHDKETIEEILDSIGEVKRLTRKESIQDYPVNASNVIEVNLYFNKTDKTTIFVYNKGKKYYIEQPYNGIYDFSVEEYNELTKYIS